VGENENDKKKQDWDTRLGTWWSTDSG